VYDDFFPRFLGELYNASAWVDVIARSGAKYFALTTKHHDGYALFDTGKTSDRSSVKLHPKRDFLRELIDAAKRERPELKRGTYFSMPEWFHPDYQGHGKVMFVGRLVCQKQ
jgi:alpha-L-fucosidase